MDKRKILLMAAIAGVAIVAVGFLLLKVGKSGPCAPVDLPAKIGYTLVMLPTVPVAMLCSIPAVEATIAPVLNNPWGMATFDAMAYGLLIFVVGVTVRTIRKSRGRGQHPTAPYSEPAARPPQG